MVKLNTPVLSDCVSVFANRIREATRLNCAIGQGKDALLLGAVVERAKNADFFRAPHAVERIEVMCVAGGELGRLEVTAAQVLVAKCIRTLSRKKMEPQPAAVGSRDPLSFSKESDKQKEHKISIDLRLQLEIAHKIFRADLARAAFKLERGVERVIDFFHKHDERTDVVIAQPSAGIVPLKLFDQPARVINADVKAIVGATEERARQLAQFTGRFSRQDRQLSAARSIDQAIFEVDPNLRVGPLKQTLDLAEERLVHKQSDGRISSSRLSN